MFLQYINVIFVVLVVQINICSSFRLAKLKHDIFSARLNVQTNDNIHVGTCDDSNKPNRSDIINEYRELEIESMNAPSVVDIDDNIMEAYDNIQQTNDDINEFDECSTEKNEHSMTYNVVKTNDIDDKIPSHEFQVPTTSTPSHVSKDNINEFDTADSESKTDRDFIATSVEDAYDEIKLNDDDDLDITKRIKLLINLSNEMTSNFRNFTEQLTELQYKVNNTTELVDLAVNMTEMNVDDTKLLKQKMYVCLADVNIEKLKSLTFAVIQKGRLAEETMKTTMNNMQEELCDMKYKLAFMNQSSSNNTTAISTNVTAINNKTTGTADFIRHGVRFIINRIKSIRLK